MSRPCSVYLESDNYYAGQLIRGRVDCNFTSEEKVRGIRVRFKGRTKVHWQQGKTHYNSDETYFEMISDLLVGETVFPPGQYSYPFTFNLPPQIPPTLTEGDGNIKYYAEGVVDRPWAVDYKEKRVFMVHSYVDLNTIDLVKMPYNINKVKHPFSFSCSGDPGQIDFSVYLPVTGYVPSQLINFTAKVKNNSKINVRVVQFRVVQGFTFHSGQRTKSNKTYKGETFEINNSTVESGGENSWNLEIRLPAVAFKENMGLCKIITSFTELRGELFLPIPHRNFKLKIPITIGSVPLRT